MVLISHLRNYTMFMHGFSQLPGLIDGVCQRLLDIIMSARLDGKHCDRSVNMVRTRDGYGFYLFQLQYQSWKIRASGYRTAAFSKARLSTSQIATTFCRSEVRLRSLAPLPATPIPAIFSLQFGEELRSMEAEWPPWTIKVPAVAAAIRFMNLLRFCSPDMTQSSKQSPSTFHYSNWGTSRGVQANSENTLNVPSES